METQEQFLNTQKQLKTVYLILYGFKSKTKHFLPLKYLLGWRKIAFGFVCKFTQFINVL